MPNKKHQNQNSRNAQAEKFIDKARELGVDEDEGAFDATLTKIATAVHHKSDCAVYNAPASEPGRCTCGAATDER